MPSYLDDTYLGEAVDDAMTEVGSADNMPAVRQGGPLAPAPEPMVRLPGGVVMPRKTALLLLAVAIAVAIYLYTRQRKKAAEP